jgi:hypothetical protein
LAAGDLPTEVAIPTWLQILSEIATVSYLDV